MLPTIAGMNLPPPPNPYAQMLPFELCIAAHRLVCDLVTKRARTPVERQDLADRCMHLLRSLAAAIDSKLAYSSGTVAPGVEVERMADDLSAWAERECFVVRRQVLRRAAEHVLGVQASQGWLRAVLEPNSNLTDEALRIHLRDLQHRLSAADQNGMPSGAS